MSTPALELTASLQAARDELHGFRAMPALGALLGALTRAAHAGVPLDASHAQLLQSMQSFAVEAWPSQCAPAGAGA